MNSQIQMKHMQGGELTGLLMAWLLLANFKKYVPRVRASSACTLFFARQMNTQAGLLSVYMVVHHMPCEDSSCSYAAMACLRQNVRIYIFH